MSNTVHVHVQYARPSTRAYVQQAHRADVPTYNRCTAQAVHAKYCTRTVWTSKHAYLRTIGASLRVLMPNTVHVQRAYPSMALCTLGASLKLPGRTLNMYTYRCTPRRAHSHAIEVPMYKYKYNVNAHVHKPTYNRCTAWGPFRLSTLKTVHVQIKVLTQTVIAASLRLPMPNTVQVQVQCARPRPRTHA